MLVYSMLRWEDLDLHAIATLPGLGELERVRDVLGIWEDNDDPLQYCLIAGHNMREKTAFPLDIPNLQKKFGYGRVAGLISQGHAEHTGDQASWLADRIQELKLRNLGHFAPQYHLLRSWRTLIKEVVFRRGVWIPIYPLPIMASPFVIIPEYQPEDQIAKWQMIPGELERIRRYEAEGFITTFEETMQYIEWLWQNR